MPYRVPSFRHLPVYARCLLLLEIRALPLYRPVRKKVLASHIVQQGVHRLESSFAFGSVFCGAVQEGSVCWRKSARESIKAKSKSLLQAQVIEQVAELKVKIGLSGSNLPPVLTIHSYISV